MLLTSQQLAALRAWLDVNAVGLNDEQAMNALNAMASPNYFVWKSSITRSEVYDQPSATGSLWDWTIFKNQTVAEQGAWREMFMGDIGQVDQINWRDGAFKIFTGSAGAVAQRDHIFACGRRAATVAEKLFAVAVAGVGSLLPIANNGNNTALARGAAGNPDNMGPGAEGPVTIANVSEARNL